MLSPSTRLLDQVKKPEEYKTVPTLKHFVLLDPDRARAWVWTREGEAWANADIDGLESEVALAGISVTLSLGEIYDGVKLAES